MDELHTLYWEECGNPSGVPVLFLHGGPGAGCSPEHRRFFDPKYYRIVLFDQRGAGRSTPYGEVTNNTTSLLVSDIEALRKMLDIESWHVFGGSWGSTLALAYAQTHPEPCLSLTLRGIFLLRASEVEWFVRGLRYFAPHAWLEFVGYLPEALRDDICEGYWTQLNHPDPQVQLAAANAWATYEARSVTLRANTSVPAVTSKAADAPLLMSGASSKVATAPLLGAGAASGGAASAGAAFGTSSASSTTPALGASGRANGGATANHPSIALARLEVHYMRANRFVPDDALLLGVERISHIPCAIVQGKYDLLCPPITAAELHAAWPGSTLRIVDDAGHSAFEPSIRSALVDIMNARRAAQPVMSAIETRR